MRPPTLMLVFILVAIAVVSIPAAEQPPPIRLAASVEGAQRLQRIDGFGVNVTPSQWRGGALAPVLDRLTGDLGSSLVRLDCYGTADWLDPAQAGPDGSWPEAYLARVYRSQAFSDCWSTFRHLTANGADVHLNVSGRAPAAWTAADGHTLVNVDAYAEMIVSLAKWAREQEKLRFTLLAPFNETDIGPPEGPRIRDEDVTRAVEALLRKMDAAGLGDVKLVVMCDAGPAPVARYRPLLAERALAGRIAVFSGHTYGDGDEQDASGSWYDQERPTALLPKAVAASPLRAASVWLSEYGDLDQSGAIEWQFSWRSTRRLLKALEDGWNAALVWDAFDNLHAHDAAWASYGLLRTDRASWTYAPRKRYFAARQIYRFVRPGFERVAVAWPAPDPKDVYATWHSASRHVRLLAFASQDGAELTVVATSRVEGDVALELSLRGLAPAAASKPLAYYRTGRAEDCRFVEEKTPANGLVRVVIPSESIVTLTTLRP